jgi:2-oxoglutarate ferredoxin oxidoreductase subunit alpha
MSDTVFTIKIGGQAGQGIKSAGILFAKFASRSGYHIYNYIEYPSTIRGGHNVMQINVSSEEVTGPTKKTDLLIALNQDSIDKHLDELTPKAGILFDSDSKLDVSKVKKDTILYPVPLSELAEEAGNKSLLRNTVALGAAAAILGGDLKILNHLIAEEYGDKGEEIVKADQKAIELGHKYAKDNYADKLRDNLSENSTMDTVVPRMVINGNEAAALGAIAGGVQFAAIYPMSPISNILHVLAAHQKEYGYIYKQPEGEIAAINMALGASVAGARSMTVTSGGGFALMVEGYGLAGITETPLVIVEGMRGGPATGIPTWSEQGDLRFVLHAHQSDFPRIVLTPGDPKEVFEMTMEAFNLADKYQTPVVVLIDKNICENDQSFPLFDTSSYKVDRGKFSTEKIPDYKRYALAENGISHRTVFGSGNFFIVNSDEHDEVGYSSEEIKNRNQQMEKRMKKLATCEVEDMPKPKLFGPEEADVTLVSWGSNKGSIIQALKDFDNVNYLHLTWANPFPTDEVKRVLGKAKHIVNIECNYTAQMGGLIKERTGVEIKDNFLRYDGRPIYVEEISEKINSVLKGSR